MNLSMISIGMISLKIYCLLSAMKIRKALFLDNFTGESSPSEEEKDLARFFFRIKWAIEFRSRWSSISFMSPFLSMKNNLKSLGM